jgi:hypothetical protein
MISTKQFLNVKSLLGVAALDAWMRIPVCSIHTLQTNCLILHSAGPTSILTHPWTHPWSPNINPTHIMWQTNFTGKQRRHWYIGTVLVKYSCSRKDKSRPLGLYLLLVERSSGSTHKDICFIEVSKEYLLQAWYKDSRNICIYFVEVRKALRTQVTYYFTEGRNYCQVRLFLYKTYRLHAG